MVRPNCISVYQFQIPQCYTLQHFIYSILVSFHMQCLFQLICKKKTTMYLCFCKIHTSMPRRGAWVTLRNRLLSSTKACSKSSESLQEINFKTPSAPITCSLNCVNSVHTGKHNVTLHPNLKVVLYGQYFALITAHFPTNNTVALD